MGVLEAGRRAAERLMTSTVEVRRYTGQITTDPVTGRASRVYEVIYRGRAKVASYEAYEATPDVAGGTPTLTRVRVDFPVGALVVDAGDEVRVLSDRVDPQLAGMILRLQIPTPYKSHATAYRVAAERVTAGA